MWHKLSLRIRIYLILSSLILVTITGGLVMVWYTYRMEILFNEIIDKNVQSFQVAAELETALMGQKGFASYYFLDGDPSWLRQLGEYRQIFKSLLNQTRSLINTHEQYETIQQIESEYKLYVEKKDLVIAYYRVGNFEEGSKLNQTVRQHFFKILDLCERYKNIHIRRIRQAKEESSDQANKLRIIAGAGMFTVFFLGVLLAFVLVTHVLEPVRKLAQQADLANSLKSENEIKALSQSVQGLLQNMDQTHSELERSREYILQSEKMAMVGKLAASMAHSIRNPFTSVKMRLFSLNRSLQLTEDQREDFEVISEEIRHVDNIVQNFLEFARPPRLKIQSISPSAVVDMAIQLLEHRLKSYDVKIRIIRNQMLPEIEGDPEQLKEVFVNLIINACEAMEKGGEIVIREEESIVSSSNRVAVIWLTDNGPGIPESIIDKIFTPFFTTKEDGSGLGLSIASRIIEEHKGRLEVTSKEGQGTTFIITLPVKELKIESYSDN